VSNPPESIKDVYEKIQDEVLLMHTKLKIYRQLFRVSDKRLMLLSECAHNFFFLIQRVLMDDVLMSLSKLTDPARTKKGNENLSFDKLRDLVERNGDQELSSKLRKILSDLKKKCRVIQTHRNKRYAHNDLETLMKSGANLERIPVEMIEEVLTLTREYMNAFERDHCPSEGQISYEEGIDLKSGAEALVAKLKMGLRFEALLKDKKIPLDQLCTGPWSSA